MQIDLLAYNEGASIYYDPSFRIVLEDHMYYLRTHPNTSYVTADAGKMYVYEFDLFGLLFNIGIPSYLHWIVMRMNNLSSPTDALNKEGTLLIPDADVIGRIQQSHSSSRRIT